MWNSITQYNIYCVLFCTGSGRLYRPMSLRCRRCLACFAPSSWRLWISWRRSRKLSGLPVNGTTNVPWVCPSWTSDPASRSTHSVAQWAWLPPWPMGRVWATWRPCQRTWRKGWRGRRGHRGCGVCLILDTKEPAAIKSSEMGRSWDSDGETVRHMLNPRTLCLWFCTRQGRMNPILLLLFSVWDQPAFEPLPAFYLFTYKGYIRCVFSDRLYLASIFFSDVKVVTYHEIIITASCSVAKEEFWI